MSSCWPSRGLVSRGRLHPLPPPGSDVRIRPCGTVCPPLISGVAVGKNRISEFRQPRALLVALSVGRGCLPGVAGGCALFVRARPRCRLAKCCSAAAGPAQRRACPPTFSLSLPAGPALPRNPHPWLHRQTGRRGYRTACHPSIAPGAVSPALDWMGTVQAFKMSSEMVAV